jgi:hypothetical protein
MADAEDHRGQYDDEQQSGQHVGKHVDNEAGSRARLRHGPSLPTARIFRSRRFFAWLFCSSYSSWPV